MNIKYNTEIESEKLSDKVKNKEKWEDEQKELWNKSDYFDGGK